MRALSGQLRGSSRLLTSLKRARLHRIATLIGGPLSGTKPEILASINDIAIQHGKHCPGYSVRELRVLSIDMGIRNLAYAFLTCKMTEELQNTPLKYEKPILCHWQRTDLMSPQSQAMDYNEGDTIRSQTPSIVDSMTAAVATDESFEPIVLAGHAHRFAKYCASLKPTHILIERQRFRSGGHSAVQEWSLRVGMLEAMLHATFRTLVEEKLLLGTTVEQVLPMRVNKFWFIDEDVPATGKAAKVAKIALVHDMLKSVGTKTASFSLHEDVRNTVDGFGAKGSRAASSKKAPALEKLDDMSDALLQGLAWLRWQENRNRLVTHGVDALGIEV